MSDPSIMSHMFISSVGVGKHENGASVLPLPLNLIALIISYVCIEYEPARASNANYLHSSIVLQTLRGLVAHVAFSITSASLNFTPTSPYDPTTTYATPAVMVAQMAAAWQAPSPWD